MAINVAGTNALGDYLVSEIANTRVLFGEAAPTDASSAAVSSIPGSSGTAAPAALTPAQLRTQVLAQQVANTQTLFGITSTGDPNATDQSAGALPPSAAETPQQVAFVAIQTENINSEFSNIATLFGSLGLGTNTDTSA